MNTLFTLLINLILALTGLQVSTPAVEVPKASVLVKDDIPAVLEGPPCEYEDGSGGPLPCYWDAKQSGNGEGVSYWILSDETTFYDEPGLIDGYVTPDEEVICPKGWDRPLYNLDGYSWSTCIPDIDGGVG